MEKIDIVVLYVDSTDKEWLEGYNKHLPDTTDEDIGGKKRFRPNPHFKYWFRGIEKYAPWINQVYLVVQSISQVPKWINQDKVKIILHKDIIPEEHLPTYNGICIPQFVHNIPGLSEKFLLADDDCYINGYIEPDDLFGKGTVKTSFDINQIGEMAVWKQIFINSHALVNKQKAKTLQRVGLMMTPIHQIRPHLKSKWLEAFEKYEDEIINSLSIHREYKNISVQFQDFYLRENGIVEERKYNCIYFSSDTPSNVVGTVIKMPNNYKLMCINDTKDDEDENRAEEINQYFKSQLPNKSKYEN